MSEAGDSPPGRDSLFPIFGSGASALRYELVLNMAKDGFVQIYEGRLSKLLLCRIAVADGKEVSVFALKVQSDSYASIEAIRGRHLTNFDVERMWERERADLDRVSSPNVVQTLAMPAAESLPVVYCSKIGRYFHPASPATGAPLRVCRDNDLLRENGLPEYTTTLRRYLHDGSAQGVGGRTFYRRSGVLSDERPKAGTKVRFETELVRDWAALVRGGDSTPRPHAGFACAGCPNATECYPAAAGENVIPALGNLVWVSFYDFHLIPLSLLDLTYDEACDLVGGGDWSAIYNMVIRGPLSQGRQVMLDRIRGSFLEGGQWMFRDDLKKFALEVLRLKLIMFSEVCTGVQAIHQQCGRPHFGITPINLMAKVLPGNIGMPARWNLRVQVVDLGSPQQFRPTAPEGMEVPCILEPGSEMESDTLFLSPMVSKHVECMMSVIVRERQEAEGRVHMRIEASGPAHIAALRTFRPGDAVLVSPIHAGREGAIWTHVEEIGRAVIVLRADFVVGGRIDGWDLQRSLIANLSFFKNYGTPCDLYGLGMVLFRTLLQNDEQDLARVGDVVQKCVLDLARDVGTGSVDERDVRIRFRRCLADRDTRAVLDSANVLFAKADRDRLASAAGGGIPQDLWDELLLFAFRLCTQMPGFSYECSHQTASPFLGKRILEDVQQLLQRLHVEMFMAEMRTREVLQVCRDMQMVLQKELLSSAGSTSPHHPIIPQRSTGFTLRLIREGSVAPAQVLGPFDKDIVRIGRRKEECDVLLDDNRISKVHARIERSSAGWVLFDSSANGTLLAGEPVPKEVAQGLHSGSIIQIQSMLLTFETDQDRTDGTVVMERRDVRILDTLNQTFVKAISLAPDDRKECMTQALAKHREAMGVSDLLRRVDETIDAVGGRNTSADVTKPGADLLASAHRALVQLSRELLASNDMVRGEEVDRFVRMLNGYVTTTGKWLVRSLAFRRRLGEEIEATTGSSTVDFALPREAGEVYKKTLDWTDSGNVEASVNWLQNAYDNLERMHAGLLEGAKRMREAIRNQMDPARIETLARKSGAAIVVNMAASSALWKAYRREFGQVLDDAFEINVLNPEFKKGYQAGSGQTGV